MPLLITSREVARMCGTGDGPEARAKLIQALGLVKVRGKYIRDEVAPALARMQAAADAKRNQPKEITYGQPRRLEYHNHNALRAIATAESGD